MENSRIDSLRRMLETHPGDVRARFGLALEYERAGAWPEAIEHLEKYLAAADDEGNAYGRLARALIRLGREGEARDVYRKGIEAANRHGHPTMAMELEEELNELR